MKSECSNYWGYVILATGLCCIGLFIYLASLTLVSRDNFVSVKGLSTKEVRADHAVWPMEFVVEGNDLPVLYKRMSETKDNVREFLLTRGFVEADISYGNTSINDNWEYAGANRPLYRYTLTSTVVISTDNVDGVIANQGCQVELLSKGIILRSNEWQLDYQFNGLNELKPIMIEEATKNARTVAQKFADDAKCKLGKIRRASQGQFSIQSNDYKPWIKNVRVVTTVDYMLN